MICHLSIDLETDNPEDVLEELATALKFSAKLLTLHIDIDDGDPE